MMINRNPAITSLQIAATVSCLLLLAQGAVRADTPNEKRRAQFARVHRIAVAAAFYGTGRLDNPIDNPKEKPNEQTKEKPNAKSDSTPQNSKLVEYLDQLTKLRDRTRALVPERLASRTPFSVVPISETEAAMKALDLTPEKLYLNAAKMKGTKFSNPDPQAVRLLAAKLHADAIVLDTMDEPRRSPDRLFFDPLGGVGISEAHVSAKIGFWVLLADGTEIFKRVSDVVHPVTKIGNRAYLFADWQEANDLAVENFLDELVRFTPERHQ